VRPRLKIIKSVDLLVESSRGNWVGPMPRICAKLNSGHRGVGRGYGLDTGLIEVNLNATYSKPGGLWCGKTDPLPLNILAIIPYGSVGDKCRSHRDWNRVNRHRRERAGSAKAGRKLKRIGGFNASIAEQQAEDALTRGRGRGHARSGVRKLVGPAGRLRRQNVSLADADSSATQVQETPSPSRIGTLTGFDLTPPGSLGFRQQAQPTGWAASPGRQKNAEATGTVLGGWGMLSVATPKCNRIGNLTMPVSLPTETPRPVQRRCRRPPEL